MRITARRDRAIRPGFTLIELLVVVAIIAIIVALSASALFRVLGAQNSANTKVLIQRIDSRLSGHISYAVDRSRMDSVQASATNLAGNDPGGLRAKVIHQKLRLKQWFPTSFAEALSGGGLPGYPPLTGYVSYLADYGITTGNSPPLPYESSACLYMILQRGPETTGESDLGVTSSTVNTYGIPVLVDAWAQPLMFVRWPTGSLVAGGGGTGYSPVNFTGAQAITAGTPSLDPLDPNGTLTSAAWLGSAQRSNFEAYCHPLPNRTGGSPTQGQSLNLAPVIASSGPDKTFGLDLFTLNVNNQAQANDNLYNH